MSKKVIKSVNLLPEVFRTTKNAKFLAGTLDQLIQPAQLERIDGYVGSTLTPTYNAATDLYIPESLPLRKHYQLDPAVVIKDAAGIVNDVIGIDDLSNEITTKGGISNNFDRLFRSEFYSYDPHIDWDKLINYQEYYWLPTGPEAVLIVGQQNNSVSTYTVQDNEAGTAFIFNPDGLTADPLITLYKGNTYSFAVSSKYNFYIKTSPSVGTADQYNNGVTNNGTNSGIITLVIDNNTPDTLFYTSDDQQYTQGQFAIKTISQNSTLNVTTAILGKQQYKSGTGVQLSNGMKIRFGGNITPVSYKDNEFFVEGVGSAIKLINYASLATPTGIAAVYNENFDATSFDNYPFDNFKSLPLIPEYITINRASQDLNAWSRYNRWVHSSVITATALANNQTPVFLAANKAARPIIEFAADLQLYNFGSRGINNVDLIDTDTTDAFSTVEGTAGYYVDGVLLEQGHRIIFNADTDALVRGKIFQVEYKLILGSMRLTLCEVADSVPEINLSVSVNLGTKHTNTNWWFNGDSWQFAQQHTTLNQPPLFDLFDNNGISYADTTQYLSNFAGSKIFGYDIGTGLADTILGFPLKYKNSVGVGSFLFKNYFMTDTFDITENQTISTISTGLAYCKFSNQQSDVYANVWKIADNYPIPILQDAQTLDSYYEVPLGLSNNPLNGPITALTLTELSDHLKTMVNRAPAFSGVFPGVSNIRDLSNIGIYGTRLISNATPMVFAHMFMGKKEHNVINAVSTAGDQYNQFKMAFLKKISEIDNQKGFVSAVDQVLMELNKDKDVLSPYYLSDMVPYGSDKTLKTWTVSDKRNTVYPISFDYDPTMLGFKSILVYLNGVQLVINKDYLFITNDASVKLVTALKVNDTITIIEYNDTVGSFIPPTPTKLGLYPKYLPLLYSDNTYVDGPVNVIQGHDGSIMIAYNDFRDDIIIELETRIYNNIKGEYRAGLIDVMSLQPSAFRNTKYSLEEINKILQSDFIKWAGFYSIDYTTNQSFNQENPFTWNYFNTYNTLLDTSVSGTWRAAYKYFYDTDRPHTNPWEMLGFTEQPSWWAFEYGPAPYSSGNDILWSDIEQGIIRQGARTGIDNSYIRVGLSNILPVDINGNLIDPSVLLASNITEYNKRKGWIFGDQSPAETAWRRSSYWPFAVQRMLALTTPAKYAAVMYDPAHMTKNISNQWTYGTDHTFLNPKTVLVHGTPGVLTNGYSVYVSEIGRQRTTNYVQEITSDLAYVDVNLFYKVGGFISKDKIQVVIDAYDPTSTSPGALLPQEDYNLILNTSNPIKSIGISGIIVQKVNDKFVIKGYDKFNPYFSVYTPVRNTNTSAVTIGGISEPYVTWDSSSISSSTLSGADITTAFAGASSKFYQQGQIVAYGNKFYRVKVSHKAEGAFSPNYYQLLSELPMTGGVTVQVANRFNKDTVTQIHYGTEFSRIQDVYDIILGYGAWLEDQGFVFDQLNTDLNTVINWNFTVQEFLYWTTQNWANNSIITLSPFADQIKFTLSHSIVDDIFNNFYEYSILRADGTAFPQLNLSVSRSDSTCTINTSNTADGIYFALLHAVQKEHAMVFNNSTIFNDTIYDIETGYRQLRMKLTGFRTANWTGDYFSPGFIYDAAVIKLWAEYTDYQIGTVVEFNSSYYSATQNVLGSAKFDFAKWTILNNKPQPGLLPNFDYKINQFEDFYSLDIDNFDSAQQKMAQHLIGYTPRVYLNNIFTNPIAQYKFYQGFIKEKGTRNAIGKLAKASIHNLQGELDFTEEWAFRVGQYGSFATYQELEVPLIEGTFIENPQIINFVDTTPVFPNDLIHYSIPSDLVITPTDYMSSNVFTSISESEVEFKLITAGYARLDDVTATAYNENSLLDIANNRNIHEGDVIWVGFKQNGDWDVMRYTRAPARISGVFVSAPLAEITFVTDNFHQLKVGSLVSISQFNDQVNGVYVVKSIPALNRFVVASSLAAIANAALPSPGLLFTFDSVRYTDVDSLPSDQLLLTLPVGTKLWVDSNPDSKWAVYQKIKNYDSISKTSLAAPAAQELGHTISKKRGLTDNIFAVSAPGFIKDNNYGKISVYKKLDNVIQRQFDYILNESAVYHTPGTPTELGHALVYDDTLFNSSYGLLFAGAPATSNIKGIGDPGNYRYSTGSGAPSARIQEGAVKISSIDTVLITENTEKVLLSPQPASYERFGAAIYVQSTKGVKQLIVGAPGTASTGTGNVYSYDLSIVSTKLNISYITDVRAQGKVLTTGSQWGYSIGGSDNSSIIAISAPGYNANTGFVQIFVNEVYSQTIESTTGTGSRFGDTIIVSADGSYMFITAPYTRNADQSYGSVQVYKYSTITNLFTLESAILNPAPIPGMRFGHDIAISTGSNVLAVSSIGTNANIHATFDKFSLLLAGADRYVNDKSSSVNSVLSTFDSDSTTFHDTIPKSGTVYVYNKLATRFILAEELASISALANTNYGYSIAIDTDLSVYVGAPAQQNNAPLSAFYRFDKLSAETNSLLLLREQDNLVLLDTIQRISLINTTSEEIINYLDVIDPLKGKIAGIAEQEITYKSAFDPAIYSIGIAGTVNDTDTNWLDNHVGEVWWDLSTVKYTWYEQGNVLYRKNNWGKLFPGSTIDIYEWVGSEYLPSEWSTRADTTAGLTEGISGQPRFADNSVISVKQIYSSVTNSFSNYYYYWVKNKITIPVSKNRRTSTYQIASMIADPTAYGLMYAAIVSTDAVVLANVGSLLINNEIHLNIATDVINNIIPKHTEWLLLQEGKETSVPNTLLEKKLIDSLLGHDSFGTLVPDPSLSTRVRYGIGIRPQQTLFKDRIAALRNLIEFTNTILLETQITGNYSLATLNKQELIPTFDLGEYDQLVEDIESLNSAVIDTTQLVRAELHCTVLNGKIRSVIIDNPGYGYTVAPKITITNVNTIDVIIETQINDVGRIIGTTIISAGSGFTDAPELIVRPYTVIVLTDSKYNNKWTSYIYDKGTLSWIRLHTQKYNTPLYWKYVDWKSSTFNQFVDYSYTVDAPYQINSLPELSPGQYIKVSNNGAGNYIVLEKLVTGSVGTFDSNFNLVYSENGTIQLDNSLWDLANAVDGFDKNNSYDQTLYSQTPDLELQYILSALKNDIFVGALRINWNLFFFKAVKYALSEQKLLDWAFKTSFINVTNSAGPLDQRPVYKLQNSQYYEDYLTEAKPYHTSIRTFTTDYTVLEPSNSFTSDFDLPAVYDKSANMFNSIALGNPLLAEYPYKAWADNYQCIIDSIAVGFPGSGYTVTPVVEIIAAPGDTGVGATAIAYIKSGKVSLIEITNPGSGYTVTPIVNILGGGDTQLIPAVCSARLANNKVRSTKIGIKFDRISRTNQLGNNIAVDKFICTGSTNEFVLSWLAAPSKAKVEITLDQVLVLGADYTIEYYTEMYNGYNKKYSKLVFLNYVPAISQVLDIKYIKSTLLLNSAERILNYYSPTDGMPGNELSQLMSGIDYPNAKISGLPFDYTTKWDLANSVFGRSAWADDIGYYNKTTISSPSRTGDSVLVLSSTDGLVAGQHANIISYTTSRFNTSTDVVVVAVDHTLNTVSFNSTLTGAVVVGDSIEFWTYDSNTVALDTVVAGGSWTYGTNNYLTGALGIAPADISIDGSNFFTAAASFAPEELVPGQVTESLGINVYTKNPQGAPVVLSNNFVINASTNTNTVKTLSIVPPNVDSVTVVFKNKIFNYSTTTNFSQPIGSTEFAIDWKTNEIIIPPQVTGGILSYTIVSIGGGRPDTEVGVVDTAITTVTDETSTVISSLAAYTTVRSVYVTVNGNSINAATTSTDYGYELTYTSAVDKRAAVNVYNLPTGTNTIQVWFFGTYFKFFNEVKEQTFVIGSTATNTFSLIQPPGILGPVAAQAFVEITDANGRRRLLPPYVSYYEITNSITKTFAIDNHRKWLPGTFSVGNVNVYVNGIMLRPGFDFSVYSPDSLVTLGDRIISAGDVVAVVGLPSAFNDASIIYRYDIIGSTLVLDTAITDAELKIITYTNHDDMLMRTERFSGTPSRRYKISRPVLDDNYVWVQVNGVPLISKVDYDMLDDQVTVQVSDAFEHKTSDEIVISSISSVHLASTIIGYRIFNDMFNRTHFKRLSKQDSTYLTKPLKFTDTEIHVADASVLTPPLVSKKIPGIIIISGERIEFFKITNNVLSQLRRSTLGTAPSFYLQENTKVIDQSPEQNIPFKESTLIQTQYTMQDVTNYTINRSSSQLSGDGITLSTDITIPVSDQVNIYYGGRLLSKIGTFYQDMSIAYDSAVVSDIQFIETASLLPKTDIIGNTYIAIDTLQVWVYTGSLNTNTVNGYSYTGLNYLYPEFTIDAVSQIITLNIVGGVQPDIKLQIVKREFERSTVWNTELDNTHTLSLMDSVTTPARFLQARPAELPDNYYYGGQRALTNNSGFILTINNDILEGF